MTRTTYLKGGVDRDDAGGALSGELVTAMQWRNTISAADPFGLIRLVNRMNSNDYMTTRLLTQNLIFSAMQAERAGGKGASWEAVTDLAALIDIYCLFDRGTVLGRHFNLHLGSTSPLSEALGDFIVTQYVSEDDASRVKTAAAAHRDAFCAEPTKRGVRSIQSLASAEITNLLSEVPTEGPWCDDWIQMHGESSPPALVSGIGVRTFLYLGYADVFKVPFTPDSARGRALDPVLRTEENVAGRILNLLEDARDKATGPLFRDVVERVSPIAAVVFQRAADRDSVVAEMRRLREDLTATRAALRDLESRLYFGTHLEAQNASNKIESIGSEVKRAFGTEPSILSVRKAINFGDELGSVVDDPTKASSWAKAMLALPGRAITRWLARRPVVELYDLRAEVPAGGRLSEAIARLFGPVT